MNDTQVISTIPGTDVGYVLATFDEASENVDEGDGYVTVLDQRVSAAIRDGWSLIAELDAENGDGEWIVVVLFEKAAL